MKSIPVRLLKLCSIVVMLAACTQVLEKPEPPRVSLVNLELESMTLFEQRFHLELRLQNPNPYPLPLSLETPSANFSPLSSTVYSIPAKGSG